jgi:hypothetical protein
MGVLLEKCRPKSLAIVQRAMLATFKTPSGSRHAGSAPRADTKLQRGRQIARTSARRGSTPRSMRRTVLIVPRGNIRPSQSRVTAQHVPSGSLRFRTAIFAWIVPRANTWTRLKVGHARCVSQASTLMVALSCVHCALPDDFRVNLDSQSATIALLDIFRAKRDRQGVPFPATSDRMPV